MKARIALTILALCLYVILFNVYIYDLTRIDIRSSKLFYNYLTLFMFIFIISDWKSGFVNDFHKQFNFICILSLIVNYIIIILTHHKIILSPLPEFFAFNGGVLAVTLIIVERGVRHGIFKD